MFLGVHRTVGIDRSEQEGVGQREALIHEAIDHAGDFVSVYTDLAKVIAPNPTHTSTAELQLAYYDDVVLESQFDSGGEGGLFEYELVYYPVTTDTGTPEGLKLPNPDGVAGIWIQNLGDDKEAYRWYLLNKTNLEADDYDRLIEYAKVFGLSGSALHSQIDDYIDVDEWLRAFAFATLSGAGDNYASYAQHNAYLYVRPEDGRVLYFPHDMDRDYSATRSLYAAPDLAKLVTDPVKQRLFLSHVYDICTSTYNTDYMSHWANQFGGLLPGQNFNSHLTFIGRRSDYALAQVTGTVPSVPFAVTNGGETVLAEDGVVTLTGTGWVDVREIHLAGDPAALPVTWTGLNTWRLELPVSAGYTERALEAVDFHGNPVGSDSVTVYSDTSGQLLRDFLRVTEVHYNPPEPSAAELAQGFADNNDFEFIELTNTGPVPLDLDGAAVTDGINYTFDGQGSPVTVAPGASVVVVRNLAAFEARYGANVPVAGQYDGKLANDGESIVLRDATGAIVEEFAYGDDPPWPVEADGDGAALHRRAVDVSAGDPENWRAAPPTPGSLVVESRVVGRYVFYNDSRFDGGDPAAGASDDDAIAPDKVPLLPGGTATLANYTSYALGINGIMIDVADLPVGVTPLASDFLFLVGNGNDPGTWTATAPTSVLIRPSDGVDDSARITILFDDHAIENRWLRVQVLAARLALREDDVFYWGNAPGETGDNAAHALVNVTDVLGVLGNLHGPLSPAAIDDRHDFNRDGLVNATDAIFARDHMTSPLGALRLITPVEEEATEQGALGLA
ncbi:MAG: lamin tail domain-containing protein, partial [Planctomycetia bacterium]|nr:lamin tail domain-containing protein [Planctomycetia bacterium]